MRVSGKAPGGDNSEVKIIGLKGLFFALFRELGSEAGVFEKSKFFLE